MSAGGGVPTLAGGGGTYPGRGAGTYPGQGGGVHTFKMTIFSNVTMKELRLLYREIAFFGNKTLLQHWQQEFSKMSANDTDTASGIELTTTDTGV